jgi:exosortase B
LAAVLPGSGSTTSPVANKGLTAWWLLLAGFAVMYLPVYWWALSTIWETEEHGHGLIVLAVLIWLFWQKRKEVLALPDNPAPLAGWPIFLFGALMYVVGQAIDITIFKFGSQIPIVLGVLLLTKGWRAARLLWFPLLYIIFMIPLPSVLVDAITGQLKQWVSVVAENILYYAGYPIGRTGVMLTIGQYQLLVADACSGLNSMFSLSALGLLFIYIMNRGSWWYVAIMVASILPIAFAANIIRVMVLVLITYYMGDEAAQGFLHGAAGMLLMVVALIILFTLDWVLSRFLIRPRAASQA